MKKWLYLFLLIVLFSSTSYADTYYCVIKVKYPAIVGYYQDDGSEELPELIEGKTYCEITEEEYTTQTVPQAKIDTAVATYNAEQKDFTVQLNQLDKAILLVILDSLNDLRAEHGLPAYTPAQFKQAIANKYDTL